MTDDAWVLQKIDTISEKVAQIDSIQAMLSSMREQQATQTETLAKLSESVAKLAVIEERQAATNAQLAALQTDNTRSFERAFGKIEALESRVDKLEQSEAGNERVRWVVWTGVGLVLTGVGAAVLKNIGL